MACRSGTGCRRRGSSAADFDHTADAHRAGRRPARAVARSRGPGVSRAGHPPGSSRRAHRHARPGWGPYCGCAVAALQRTMGDDAGVCRSAPRGCGWCVADCRASERRTAAISGRDVHGARRRLDGVPGSSLVVVRAPDGASCRDRRNRSSRRRRRTRRKRRSPIKVAPVRPWLQHFC